MLFRSVETQRFFIDDTLISISTSIGNEPNLSIILSENSFNSASVFKIASFESNYHDLIAACVKTRKPVVISTGLCSKKEIEEIINKTKDDNENFYLLGVSYWYLDEFSCVLVKRNELWFKKSLSEIEKVWNIIEKERVDGYEHRASKKRRPSIDNTEKVGCLIQLNEDSM